MSRPAGPPEPGAPEPGASGFDPADFRLEDNCVRIGDENRARVYFAQHRRALDRLQRAVADETSISNAERVSVEGFVAALRRTVDALALRHFYSSAGRELKIDATDSGFFHFSTLLELAADLAGRDARLAALPAKRELKEQMLRQIVDYSLHPRELQVTMLERLYLESLEGESLFRSFRPDPLAKVGDPDDASYFWSFAHFDRASNRPFLYLLYFEHADPLSAEAPAFAELQRVAEQTASGRLSLLAFSNLLDERLARVHPRIVKRLALGPYWSPHFTRVEGALGPVLEAMAERLPFAMRWETETLISERETRVGAGWLSKGQLRQVFWVPKQLDLSQRGVSQFERCVLLPHWLSRQLREAGVLADHRHVVIEDDPGIHGLH